MPIITLACLYACAHVHAQTHTRTFTIVKIFHHIFWYLKSLSIGDNAFSIFIAGWSGFSTGLKNGGISGVFSATK